MITYQDFVDMVGDGSDKRVMDVSRAVIADYMSSDAYKMASTGYEYMTRRNTTILEYKKLLYTITGKAVTDQTSPNHKIPSGFFPRFVTQEVQFLLANGVTFDNDSTKKKLGGNDFDTRLQKLARAAIWGGVSYGMFNYDHIETFTALEFAPVYDEENGAIKAGVRFWQLDDVHPLRATLYELDGYTEMIWRDGRDGGEILQPKRAYTRIYRSTDVGGVEIYDGQNYEGFPIVPLWGNQEHMSELYGRQESIDCYDLIKSGFANDLDEASLIYWTLQNTGGMDDIDLVRFIERMKTIHAAVVGEGAEGASAEAHTMDIPYESRTVYLDRLEKDLYADFMAFNVADLSGGNKTATEINAAYEPLNQKANDFEYCLIEFIGGILKLAGIEDFPKFKRDKITNDVEMVDMILSAAEYLDQQTLLEKLPFLTPEEVQTIIERKEKEEMSKFDQGGRDDIYTQGAVTSNLPGVVTVPLSTQPAPAVTGEG